PESIEPLLDELRVLTRLDEVILVELVQRGLAREVGRTFEERDRLLLDRVRIGEVLPELLFDVRGADLAQRGIDCAVVALLEPSHHRALFVAELASRAGDVRLLRAIGGAREELVRRDFERLVAVRVREKLAG